MNSKVSLSIFVYLFTIIFKSIMCSTNSFFYPLRNFMTWGTIRPTTALDRLSILECYKICLYENGILAALFNIEMKCLIYCRCNRSIHDKQDTNIQKILAVYNIV